MYNYTVKNIAEAHRKACGAVIQFGETVVTEDGATTLELDEPLAILIDNPFSGNMVHPNNKLSERALQEYLPEILTAKNTGHVYTYGQRLHEYEMNKTDIVDQMEIIVNALRENHSTRRAIAHTWYVGDDNVSKTPPCLQSLQFVWRADVLNMVAYFRSNDMCNAYGANMYGLAHLQQRTARELETGMGYLQSISMCAHIYEGDLQTARAIAHG